MYTPVDRTNRAGVARVQRKAQILTVLYDQRFPEQGAIRMNTGEWAGWLTSGQVARCCEMSASPHFRQLLNELFTEKVIVGQSTPYHSTATAYYWQIAENTRFSAAWIGVFDAYLGETWAEKMGDQQAVNA